jgi:hypothetical protein
MIYARPLSGDPSHLLHRLSGWRGLSAALAFWLAGATGAAAQSILIDFGAGNNQTQTDDSGRYWNNLTDGNGGLSDTGQLLDLVSLTGDVTPVGLVMVRRFTGANTNGTQAGTVYAGSATADSLYGNTEVWNGLTNVFPSFKLTGLAAQKPYRLTFYASRMGVGDNRETGYTVNGVNSGFAALDAANNEETTASISGIVPTAGGEVTITLGPTENNNNAYHFTYLGALLLEEDDAPPPEPVVIFQEPGDQTVLQARPAQFVVQVQGTPPYTVQWRKNGEPIAQATELTYRIPSATLDLNGAAYSAIISNATSTATTRNAVLTVTPDTQAPGVASTAIHDTSTFLIRFDEPITGPQASSPSGYTATTQDGPIVVTEVEVQENGQQVRLVLAQPASGTLTIGFVGLVDLAGNAVPTATQAVIPIPIPPPNTFLVDFGGGAESTNPGASPDDPISLWNNVTGVTEGAGVSGLITADGTPTDASLFITSRFGGVNGDGTRDAAAPFPVKATRDSFYANTAEFSGLSDLTPKMSLTGLDPAMVYDFTFFGSRINAGGDNRETRYTVSGVNTGSAELNAAENVAGTAVITGIVPVQGENGGEILIELTPSENNTNPNQFIYLGVMTVAFREPTVGPVDPVILTPVISDGKVTVNWTGAGQLQWSSSLKATEWTPVLPAPTAPYVEDLALIGHRYYRVVKP